MGGNNAGLVVGAHEDCEEDVEYDPGAPEEGDQVFLSGEADAGEEERYTGDEEAGFLMWDDAEN